MYHISVIQQGQIFPQCGRAADEVAGLCLGTRTCEEDETSVLAAHPGQGVGSLLEATHLKQTAPHLAVEASSAPLQIAWLRELKLLYLLLPPLHLLFLLCPYLLPPILSPFLSSPPKLVINENTQLTEYKHEKTLPGFPGTIQVLK